LVSAKTEDEHDLYLQCERGQKAKARQSLGVD
jgi:hypothetical protein